MKEIELRIYALRREIAHLEKLEKNRREQILFLRDKLNNLQKEMIEQRQRLRAAYHA